MEYHGEAVTTGIFKSPVEGRVPIAGLNLRGDAQADRENHGGPIRTAYAYAEEDYLWWQETLARKLPPGTFGENFTLRGIDVSGALIGERWRIGTAVLSVTSPRVPCYKLGMVMGDPRFIRSFARALRPGAYLGIVETGDVGAGDTVEVIERPAHKLTLEAMAQIYLFEQERRRELLVPQLPEEWRSWAMQTFRRKADSN
ncbi:MAG: MOSC domain-containing protein [Candidatus Baltobacteraceae bacterium]